MDVNNHSILGVDFTSVRLGDTIFLDNNAFWGLTQAIQANPVVSIDLSQDNYAQSGLNVSLGQVSGVGSDERAHADVDDTGRVIRLTDLETQRVVWELRQGEGWNRFLNVIPLRGVELFVGPTTPTRLGQDVTGW